MRGGKLKRLAIGDKGGRCETASNKTQGTKSSWNHLFRVELTRGQKKIGEECGHLNDLAQLFPHLMPQVCGAHVIPFSNGELNIADHVVGHCSRIPENLLTDG